MTTSYLDTSEAAALLKIDIKDVQELCRSGRLPGAIKHPERGTWLIPSGAVTSWLVAQSGEMPAKDHDPESEAISGDRFQVGDISSSNVAIGRSAQVQVTQGLSGDELESLFELVYQRIQSRPEDPNVDKEEISNTVQNIEEEAAKDEEVNPNKIERWLKNLALMAPDILDVTVAALLSPGAALSEVIRKVAAKAKQEAGSAESASN